MHLISRLRDDADLKYLYQGPKKTEKGRHRKYAGKVNKDAPDLQYFSLEESNSEYQVFSAVVYSNTFKRKIRAASVVFLKDGKQPARKMYFPTGLLLTASLGFMYYRSRFQIELIYRDAKQHTGLNHCQGRSRQALDFHWNAALNTVNSAKIQHRCESNPDKGNFSATKSKTLYNNMLLLERFSDVFGINTYSTLNQKRIKDLLYFGYNNA